MMGSDQLGEAPIDGVMYDGNSVSFSAEVDAQGQTLVLDFSGTIEGDSVSGEFGSDFGAFAVTGTRASNFDPQEKRMRKHPFSGFWQSLRRV